MSNGNDAEPTDPDDFPGWARQYFGAKSRHDLESLVGRFDPEISYEDAVLARTTVGRDRMRAIYEGLFASSAEDSGSTLVWAVGGRDGGAVQFHNGPGLFGAPMHVLGVIELVEGRVVRQRDYWDGLSLPSPTLTGMRERFQAHLATNQLAPSQRSVPAPVLVAAAGRLRAAIESGGPVADAFAPDAVLRDLARATELTGLTQLAAGLGPLVAGTPWGPGARETNIVGTGQGGAWEWTAAPGWTDTVGAGLSAVRLDESGRIAELTVAWDSSRLDPSS